MKRKKQKKKTNFLQRLFEKEIPAIISKFGSESIEIAEMYLKLGQLALGRPGSDDTGLIPFHLQTDSDQVLHSATILEWYVFWDLSEADTLCDQIEGAFSAAAPTWSTTDPEACVRAARTLWDLANGYQKIRDLIKWEERSKRAVEWSKTHLEPGHAFIVEILNEIGAAFLAQGRIDEAEAVLREAWGIHESNPELLASLAPWSLMNLAGVAFKRGQTATAKSYLDRVMELLEQLRETKAVAVLEVLCNYANIYREIGNLEELARVCQRAEEVAEDVWKSEPEWAVVPMLGLIRLHETLNKFDDAERLMRILLQKMLDAMTIRRVGKRSQPLRQIFLAYCAGKGVPLSLLRMDREIVIDALGL